GCESGLDQFDHHVEREPVRTQDRLGVTVTAPGKQFEGAAAVRIGTAIVASGRHRYSHNYRPDPPRPRDGSGLATAQPVCSVMTKTILVETVTRRSAVQKLHDTYGPCPRHSCASPRYTFRGGVDVGLTDAARFLPGQRDLLIARRDFGKTNAPEK